MSTKKAKGPAKTAAARATSKRTAEGASAAGSAGATTTTASARKAAAAKETAATRRDALREQQQAAARQKRRMRIAAIICGVLALAIIAVVATVIWQDQKQKRETRNREAAAQTTPPNAVGTEAILVNPDTAAQAKYTLSVYVDYQCPVCKDTEEIYGEVWKKLADEGFVKLQIHTMTFMGEHPALNNEDSKRLAIGAACADMRGKYWQFHNTAYEHQPQKEGREGYSDADIEKNIAQKAGITGAEYDTWRACLDNNSTSQFVRLVDEAADKSGVTGTPTLKVNGKNPEAGKAENGSPIYWWQQNLEPTVEAWKAAIEKAANS